MQFVISVGSAFHWGVFAQFLTLTPLANWGTLTLYAWRPLKLRMRAREWLAPFRFRGIGAARRKPSGDVVG